MPRTPRRPVRKKAKKKVARKRPAARRRPVRKKAAKKAARKRPAARRPAARARKAPAKGGRKPAAKGRGRAPAKGQPRYAARGVASRLDLAGHEIPITQRRPKVRVSQEKGFNVYTRKIGPKGKKITI